MNTYITQKVSRHLYALFTVVFLVQLISPVYAEFAQVPQRVVFTENKGQIIDDQGNLRPDLLYIAESGNLKVYLAKEKIHYVLTKPSASVDKTGNNILPEKAVSETERYRVTMELMNSNPDVDIRVLGKTESYTNFYYEHCPQGITNVSSYSQIIYENIYSDIDLIFQETEGGLKYDFVIKPGGDIRAIKLVYKGAKQLILDKQSELRIVTPVGTLTESIPLIYQLDEAGNKQAVKGGYKLKNGILGFSVPEFNSLNTLIIDPWITYLGGAGNDQVHSIASGTDNSVIVVGETTGGAPAFPTTDGSTFQGADDIFVSKYNADGVRLWTTLYGSAVSDEATSVAIDKNNSNAIFFTGITWSNAFPVPAGSPVSAYGGGNNDAYIVKMNYATGAAIWARFYGGAAEDGAYSILMDPATDDIILGGITASPNLPVSCTDVTYPTLFARKSDYDSFIARFDNGGTAVQWSGYIGGTDTENRTWLALSGTDIIVSGYSESPDFTAFAGNAGSNDMYVIKIGADCSYQWGRFFGGSQDDRAEDVTVSPTGNIIITGTNRGRNFPTTAGTLYPVAPNPTVVPGPFHMVVCAFGPTGTPLWATYYGGSMGNNSGFGVKTDNIGNIYLAGSTSSADFPVVEDAQDTTYGGGNDAFFAKITPTGDSILCGTFLGGSGNDVTQGLELDALGMVLLGGYSTSADFDLINPFDSTFGGGNSFGDAFIAKICSECGSAVSTIMDSDSIAYPDSIFICSGDSLILLAYGFGTIAWTTLPPSATLTDTLITIKPTVTTTYILTMTAGSCLETDTLVVVVGSVLSAPVVPADTVCAGDSTSLNASGSGPFYRWFSDVLAADTLEFSSASFQTGALTADTTFYVEAYSANGCKSAVIPVAVEVDMPPVVSITVTPVVCIGTEVLFKASGALSYVWRDTLQGILSNADSLKVTPPAGLNKYYLWSTSGKCTVLDSVTVQVDTFPNIAITGPTTICLGQTVTLTASGGATYLWSNGNTGNSLNLQPSGDTTLYVDGTRGACTSRDSITITISSNMSPPGIQGDTVLCVGESAVLTAVWGSNVTYTWYSDSLGNNVIDSDSAYSSSALTSDTIYYVQVNSGACESTIRPVLIEVNPLPVPAISGTTSICRGESTTLTASGGVTYLWTWSGGNTNTDNSITVSPVNTTTYMLRIRNSDSCYKDTSVTVTANPSPEPEAGSPRTICKGDQVTIGTAGSSANTYSWSPSSGLNDPSLAQPVASPVITTLYIVTVTDNSCIGTDTVLITVDSCSEYNSNIYVPSAFTPADEEPNNVFIPRLENIDQYSLKIFNRWGGVLFETSKPEEYWDGKYNNAEVEPGAYIYWIKATGLDGKNHNLTGTVSIIK